MQVKYIVYYRTNEETPAVDIWKTAGDMIHSVYAQKNNIEPKNISSMGYLYFNPVFRRWFLEHYQMGDGIPARNLKELIRQRRFEKKDRLLVKREIFRAPFLNDPQLKKETWKDRQKMNIQILRQLFTFQYN